MIRRTGDNSIKRANRKYKTRTTPTRKEATEEIEIADRDKKRQPTEETEEHNLSSRMQGPAEETEPAESKTITIKPILHTRKRQ